MQQRPTIVINRKVWSDIYYLHKKIGNIEWSGIVWADVQGTISDPSNLKITTVDFTLKDIGSTTLTEFEFGEDIFEVFDEKPELIGKKILQLHSHHSLKSFFSGTDWADLEEGSRCHNYFVSIIVNKDGEIAAKIGLIAKINSESKVKYTYKDDSGTLKTTSVNEANESEQLVVYDCNVEVENDLDSVITKIKSNKKPVYSQVPLFTKEEFSPKQYHKQTEITDYSELFIARCISLDETIYTSIHNAIKDFSKTPLSSIEYKDNLNLLVNNIFYNTFDHPYEVMVPHFNEMYEKIMGVIATKAKNFRFDYILEEVVEDFFDAQPEEETDWEKELGTF